MTSEARNAILKYRHQIEEYIKRHPEFGKSFTPLPGDRFAPPIVKDMMEASQKAQVGPMAAVAGAIAQYVGKDLLEFTPEIIVENGGDIYINCFSETNIKIFAGNSILSGKVGLRIDAGDSPMGICTSSATVGPSLSFGKADAVTVISPSTPLADAAATSLGNLIKEKNDVDQGLEYVQKIESITGAIIIIDDKLGSGEK